MDTFGTGTKCPFYRGVRLIEVSIKRESTVERLRVMFTANSRCEFVACDRVFPLLFIMTT